MTEYEALLRLQEIDLELLRYDKALKSMPQQKRLRALELAKRKLSSQLTQIVGQRKDAEMEVEHLESSHQKVLDAISETKEEAYQREAGFRHVNDLEARLTSLAKQQEKLEYRHGEQVEELDRLRHAEENAQDLLDRLEDQRKDLTASFEQQSSDAMAKVRSLAHEREQVKANISSDVMASYDKAFKRFGGLAVERLRGNVPSICRIKLPPSSYGDVTRKHRSICECPNCHRLLVTEDIAEGRS